MGMTGELERKRELLETRRIIQMRLDGDSAHAGRMETNMGGQFRVITSRYV